MSNTRCQACHADTDAFLCARCTDCGRSDSERCRDCLVDTIAELPARIRDLELAVTRQARVGNTPRRLPTVPAEHAQADAEQRNLPAWLRTREGRITLPTPALPVDRAAAALHGHAVTAVLTWARHLAETHDVDLPQPTPARRIVEHSTLVEHDDATVELVTACTWTWERSTVTVEALCSWLVEYADSIRMDEAAGEMHARLADLAAAIDATVDRRPPDVFAGKCTTTDVRMIDTPLAGPPCSGLHCHHQSCGDIRRGSHQITPVIGECGAPLEAVEGETSVECQSCGTVWDITERRGWMAGELADTLGTTRQVAGFLRTLEVEIKGQLVPLEVTVDRIDGWLRRGTIAGHGTDPNGHRLVKVGEVREHAEQWERRRAARRSERIAS